MKSQRTEGKREDRLYWKITLNVQQRPNSNTDSGIFSVSYVFKGVLRVERKYLNAGENLGPRIWIP